MFIQILKYAFWTVIAVIVAGLTAFLLTATQEDRTVVSACWNMAWKGFRPVREVDQSGRFLGKVERDTAICRGIDPESPTLNTPWVDWSNYHNAGDASSKATGGTGPVRNLLAAILAPTGHIFDRDTRGLDGALLDLEYQRMELIRFNLYDNTTYHHYAAPGGPLREVWPEMRLAPVPDGIEVDASGDQLCTGELIRFRNLTGICNDLQNPAMGSSGQLFARNVAFEATYPRLGEDELARNRHGDRLDLLKPDPQLISRTLFTRPQSAGHGCAAADAVDPAVPCDYTPASFFNVLAAYWIQFMTHDWFSHMEEARNDVGELMPSLGCFGDAVASGCRPEDAMEPSLYADTDSPPRLAEGDGLARSFRTTRNTVTAWWDASQIYGHDDVSQRRVKRDPDDPAKLWLEQLDGQGRMLPLFGARCEPDGATPCDPIQAEWAGQAAVAFPDNWSIGLSFYHNLFAREHNAFVDAFRSHAAEDEAADSGLRDPSDPERVITYGELAAEAQADTLFEIARLVIAAEIAKIHTIEWTTQLLYNEPMFEAMNSNWHGLFADKPLLEDVSARLLERFADADDEISANLFYSAFNAGPGIIGTGASRDDWSLSEPSHVNGGTNHFGSPFNFPEEFTSVYRLHPLLPDLIEYRDHGNPNAIVEKVPVMATFRGAASPEMRARGLENWAVSLGRQRLGALVLQNHPHFLQNLDLRPRLDTMIDVAALDLIRDRERGVPRFNEFRRQIGLRQLTSFDDFIDVRLLAREADGSLGSDAETLARQRDLVARLREVYGTHECDASKIISVAQIDPTGRAFADDPDTLYPTDCLGHSDGTVVDNVEDVDVVVGWLAETTRPHGFAISETQFHIFILNASRRLFSDRFFTSSYRPEFYTQFGLDWVNNNGPSGKQFEAELQNGHEVEVSPLKRVLLRAMPALADEMEHVVNVFDPWARDRGTFYTLNWTPRSGAEADPSFAP